MAWSYIQHGNQVTSTASYYTVLWFVSGNILLLKYTVGRDTMLGIYDSK